MIHRPGATPSEQDRFWPWWYQPFIATAVVATLSITVTGLLIRPGETFSPSPAFALTYGLVPTGILVSILMTSRHPAPAAIAAALFLDVEALLTAWTLVLGMAYAILFPMIGVAILITFARGRVVGLGFVLAGVTSVAGVTLSYTIGPIATLPKIGFLPLTVANVAVYVTFGLVHLRLLDRHRIDALAAARAELASRRAAENLLGAIVDSSPVPIQAYDADGRVMLWNTASERTFGWTAAEVMGNPQPPALVPEDDLGDSAARFGRMLSGDVVAGDRVRRVTQDGRELWIDLYSAPLTDAEGRIIGVAGQMVDVTDRVTLDNRLRQAAKMEAIGTLAGGVAHDFNNLLTAIRGYAELALESLGGADGNGRRPDGDVAAEAARDLEEVIGAADRATALTRQLMAFARKAVAEPRVLSPADVIARFGPLLGRLLGERVDLRIDLAADAGRIVADPAQLEQIILNLAVNARDAMPEGGELRIAAAAVQVGPGGRGHPDARPGSFVEITVADQGAGMDDATMARIFEPFFTTKEPGRGTGLGLATVFGIVQASNGWIEVDSNPGAGTTFRLYFPRVPDSDATETDAGGGAPLPAGTETVLLVEDDDKVRGVARRWLEGLGYRVLEASGGAEALELALSYAGPIDILVTDVVMTGMQGPELVADLARIRPETKALLCSGFPGAASTGVGALPDLPLLNKPYTRESLAMAVQEVLRS
jgi:two-component system cell cycle sensor histidine kinase/response regulator CckA